MKENTKIEIGKTYRIKTVSGLTDALVLKIININNTRAVKWTSRDCSGLTILSDFKPIK